MAIYIEATKVQGSRPFVAGYHSNYNIEKERMKFTICEALKVGSK